MLPGFDCNGIRNVMHATFFENSNIVHWFIDYYDRDFSMQMNMCGK
jgi:hypothetical protein